MKYIIKCLLGLYLLMQGTVAFAGSIYQFEVIANPEKIQLGESVDFSIKAVDKNNKIIKDFSGVVLILSETDREADFPKTLENHTYEFKESDGGIKKFENAVRFSKTGKHDIHVYDLGDGGENIVGMTEVEVVEKKKSEREDIVIVSPENGITIGGKVVIVSGKAKKNHQIKIVLNNKENILTTSNSLGIFEKEIEDLPDGQSIIHAFILNADGEEIGKSSQVKFISDATMPVFNKISISPNKKIKTSEKIKVTVYATKGLTKVEIILNDVLVTLKEGVEGVYTADVFTPNKVGIYAFDVILQDELGHKLKKVKALSFKTIERVVPVVEVPVVKVEKEELKRDNCPNGDYTKNIFDGQCGTKPVKKKEEIDLIIKNLRGVKLKTKSVLMWDKVEKAIRYEVYKKIKGKNTFGKIATVKDPKYEIEIKGEEIIFDYYAVKAVGKIKEATGTKANVVVTKEVKGDISDAIKVQTGAKEIILIIFALLISFGLFVYSRREKIGN